MPWRDAPIVDETPVAGGWQSAPLADAAPSAPPSDPRTAMFERGQAADAARRGELREMFGPEYAPGTAPINMLRGADVARGATFEQRQRKFQSYFPEGGLISARTAQGPVELARTAPGSPYQEMSGASNFLAGLVSEPTIGGMLGAFGGAPGVAAGTAAGVLAQNAIEQARGFGDPNIPIGRALTEGGAAGVADAASRRVIRAFGGGTPRFTKAPDPVQAAKVQGLEPLAVGQLSESPLLRGMYRQVGATGGRIEQQITAQERSLLESVKRNTGQELSETDLTRVLVAQRKELDEIFRPTSASRADAGQAVQEGLDRYETTFRKLIDQQYARAEALGADVRFDLRAAQNLATEIERGVLGRAARPQGAGALGARTDPAGPIPDRDAVRVGQNLSGELANVVQTLKQLDPSMSRLVTASGEFGAFQQLRALRTRLWDLQTVDDAMTRREARRLWGALSDAMYNPITDNPAALRAFRQAAASNTMLEDSLQKSFVLRAAATDTPEQIARKLFHPGAKTEIETLRRVLPRDSFEQVRGAFMADLAREETAAQGLNRLRSFRANDPQALDLMLSPAQQRTMEQFLLARQKLDSGPLRQVFEESMSAAERASTLLKRAGASEIGEFVRLGGGAESPAAKALRAAVYKDVLDSAVDVARPSGVEVLDSSKVIAAINRWQTSGKLDGVFRPEDWARLKDFRAYATPISEAADIGGGMMAGALRQRVIEGVSDLPAKGPTRVLMSTLRPIVSNNVTAFLLSRPAGTGSTMLLPGATNPYRQMAIALSSAHRETEARKPSNYTGPVFRQPRNALSGESSNEMAR
jgi:hypothetical protein